jgi:hypothetical protein
VLILKENKRKKEKKKKKGKRKNKETFKEGKEVFCRKSS